MKVKWRILILFNNLMASFFCETSNTYFQIDEKPRQKKYVRSFNEGWNCGFYFEESKIYDTTALFIAAFILSLDIFGQQIISTLNRVVYRIVNLKMILYVLNLPLPILGRL